MEHGLTPQRLVSELAKSPHGKLIEYEPTCVRAAGEAPDLLAHLIAWNERNGQVRDSKVALPVASLIAGFPYQENSLAHLGLLSPRDLARAWRFSKELKHGSSGVERVIVKYLRQRESSPKWLERAFLQHRRSMRELYAVTHTRPSDMARALFDGAKPAGSSLEAVARLGSMTPTDAAAAIVKHRLPYLTIASSMGAKLKDPDVLGAMLSSMTPSEVVTNVKLLERLGVKDLPHTRALLEQKLGELERSKKITLKTAKAASAATDEKLKARLEATQEKQVEALGGIDGDWLVLGDRSSSMQESVEAAKHIAATLAGFVKGRVLLVFFNTFPTVFDVTGMTLEQVLAKTKGVIANGGTSIGCGLRYALDNGFLPQGIAVVSDGAENSAPFFAGAYKELCAKVDSEPPVYLYWMKCYQANAFNNDPDMMARLMTENRYDLQTFDLRQGAVDYYSLPNLVQTMKASRYKLLDDIMSTPLLTFADVFAADKVAA